MKTRLNESSLQVLSSTPEGTGFRCHKILLEGERVVMGGSCSFCVPSSLYQRPQNGAVHCFFFLDDGALCA